MQPQTLHLKRIEIPVHYDMWMRGARFGLVTSIGPGGEFIRVRLDAAPRRRLKVWRADLEYVRVCGGTA